MALFRLTVEKYSAAFSEYWVNVYWLTGASVDEFTADVNAVVAAERALYLPHVVITKARVDDGVKNTDVFRTYIYNQSGLRTGPVGDVAPLWVTARVDLQAALGRPSRKYLRGCMVENDFSATALAGPMLTALQTYGDAIIGTAAVVDVDGQELIGASPFNAPQMRQLRRGSKKSSPHSPVG